ncbi:MAG: DHHA1 domain-containing protein, partial [Actinomycetota bacterium]|nr:DHHA1 domain-containing protein [Actinomycetota bacterium]
SNLLDALDRLNDRARTAEKELEALRSRQLQAEVAELAGQADGGVVVARLDGRSPDALREMAQGALRARGLRAVAIGGSPDGVKASIAVAVDTSSGLDAGAVVKAVAPRLGGGGGGSPALAVAGGKDPAGVDAALDEARRLLGAG